MEEAGKADDDPPGGARHHPRFHREALTLRPRPDASFESPEIPLAQPSIIEIKVLAEPRRAVDDVDRRAAQEH